MAMPFLLDISSQDTEWLKTHLKCLYLEVINQHDSNFITALELAVHFRKTNFIQEMGGVDCPLPTIETRTGCSRTMLCGTNK